MIFERLAIATNPRDIYALVARLAREGWEGLYASFVDSRGAGGGYPLRRSRWFERDDLTQPWLPFPEMTPWQIIACHPRCPEGYHFKVTQGSFTPQRYTVVSGHNERTNQPFGHLVALEIHRKVLTPTGTPTVMPTFTLDMREDGTWRDRIAKTARLAQAFGATGQQLSQWAAAVAPPAPDQTSDGPAARPDSGPAVSQSEPDFNEFVTQFTRTRRYVFTCSLPAQLLSNF